MLYAISILFVFLCLAALYESWTVPLSVMLAVPLGVVGALLATYTRGLTNDDIAARLFLSPLTVKTHINRAMSKLGARDRAQLVVVAYQSGLVRPGDAD